MEVYTWVMGYLQKTAQLVTMDDYMGNADIPTGAIEQKRSEVKKILDHIRGIEPHPVAVEKANKVTDTIFERAKLNDRIQRMASKLHDVGAASSITGGGIGGLAGAGLGALMGGEDRTKGALIGALLGSGAGAVGMPMFTSTPVGKETANRARAAVADMISRIATMKAKQDNVI